MMCMQAASSGGQMYRFLRPRRPKAVPAVLLAVALMTSVVGLVTASNANAADPPACVKNGKTASPPQAVVVAGKHPYAQVNCKVVPPSVSVYWTTSDGKGVDLKHPVGTIAAGTNFFLCGLPFGGNDMDHKWVLTQADNFNWGWVRAKWLANTFPNGNTNGVPNCANYQGAAPPAPANPKNAAAAKYNVGVTSDPSATCQPNGRNVKVPAGTTLYGGHVYKIVVCTNDLGDGDSKGGLEIKQLPSSASQPIDVLRSTQSFFVCGIPGGDNTEWLLTQGDDHLKWGWVRASFIKQTVNQGDPKNGGFTRGVVNCNQWIS